MNGKDLLEAMSLVDEKYVDEAENKGLKRGMPMGWLSVAACLCVLIGGALFWLQPWAGSDSASAENMAAADMELDGTMAGKGNAPEASEMNYGDTMADAAYMTTSDPSVYIRILEWNPDGFVGEVADVSAPDRGNIESGTILTVYFDDNTSVMIQTEGQNHRWEDRMPTEEDFPVGTLVNVQYHSVAADGSVVAAVIDAVEE